MSNVALSESMNLEYDPKKKAIPFLEPPDLHIHLAHTSCDHRGECYSFCSHIATWHSSPLRTVGVGHPSS